MTSGVTPTNVIMGVGKIYIGAYGAAEPADTAAAMNAAPAASAWTPMGATQDGVSVIQNQEFAVAQVDQVADPVARNRTSREFQIKTSLAEATLENLLVAWNDDGTITTGSGYRSIQPEASGDEMDPKYRAVLFDGYGPADSDGTKNKRRIIGRKVLSVDSVESAYKKDGVLLVPVTFACHFVSDSVKPIKIIEETNTVS